MKVVVQVPGVSDLAHHQWMIVMKCRLQDALKTRCSEKKVFNYVSMYVCATHLLPGSSHFIPRQTFGYDIRSATIFLN